MVYVVLHNSICSNSKVLHIVRHGQGVHNLAASKDGSGALGLEEYADACLTSAGWHQAKAMHHYMRKLNILEPAQLIVVSPLLRTLQTAQMCIVGLGSCDDDGKTPNNSALPVDMSSRRESPRFVANEWCRERMGCPCNRRSNISSYRGKFPMVDFSEIGADEDKWWSPVVERIVEVRERAKVFLNWVMDRPETNIVLISHSTFLSCMLEVLVKADGSDNLKEMSQRKFRNCEMRSLLLSDQRDRSPRSQIVVKDCVWGAIPTAKRKRKLDDPPGSDGDVPDPNQGSNVKKHRHTNE